MTPKEKAKELVGKFIQYVDNCSITSNYDDENAKKCALIAVDEILKEINYIDNLIHERIEYWQQVKTEIELV